MKYIISAIGGVFVIMLSARKIFHHLFMNLAIGRKTVNIEKYKKARPYTRLITDAGIYGEWMKAQKMEEISIKSRDGFRLTGHYLIAPNPRRILLMVHGWRSGWIRDFAAMAARLHEYGCNLLLIEQRAHGRSEGKYIGFGVLERYDCVDWIHYLTHERKEELPIYLTGLSMGASTVLMAAGLELPRAVKGVIADCGFTSPYEMVTRVAARLFHVRPRTVKKIDRMCCKKAGYSLNECTTLKAMAKCRVPILFVHGTADSFVPMEMTLQNYRACGARKKLFLVEGAEHCKSFTQDMEGYVNTIRQFFHWDKDHSLTESVPPVNGVRYFSRQAHSS